MADEFSSDGPDEESLEQGERVASILMANVAERRASATEIDTHIPMQDVTGSVDRFGTQHALLRRVGGDWPCIVIDDGQRVPIDFLQHGRGTGFGPIFNPDEMYRGGF